MLNQLILSVIVSLVFSILFYLFMNYLDKKSKFKRNEIRYIEIKAKTKFEKDEQAHLLLTMNRYYAFIFFVAALFVYNIESLWIVLVVDTVVIVGGLLLSVRWMNEYVNKILLNKKTKKSQK